MALTEALRTVVADVGRLQNLLPELSPRDRCGQAVGSRLFQRCRSGPPIAGRSAASSSRRKLSHEPTASMLVHLQTAHDGVLAAGQQPMATDEKRRVTAAVNRTSM